MRIAIPTNGPALAGHFGHCQTFTFFDLDPANPSSLSTSSVDAPPHQPGFLPAWLKQHRVDLVIAGGMGERAKALLAEYSIQVILGAPEIAPAEVLRHHLAGTLVTTPHVCHH